MNQMTPSDGFVLRIPPQPTAPSRDGVIAYTIQEVHKLEFRPGRYRFTTYCAGFGTVNVSYKFVRGNRVTVFSAGGGGAVTCEEEFTAGSSWYVTLPLGASRIEIDVDPFDMYSNQTRPRAAIAFTVERVSDAD